jgi:hypothetical protein
VAWEDGAAQREAVLHLMAARPERAAVRALVAHYSWQRVAARIAACYAELASPPLQAAAAPAAEEGSAGVRRAV